MTQLAAATSVIHEQETPADASATRRQTASLYAAWTVLAALLVLGVPLFLRMGLWVDSTFYDLAARTVIRGGLHYRDVFDTNLPGMLWLHIAIRWMFGWSSEALRAVDLAILTIVVWLLTRYLALLGASGPTRIWTAVALYACYFSLPEVSHCQRDFWMMAPALAALHLRQRRATFADEMDARATPARLAAAEGLCWGAGIWIKPFVAFVAAGCAFLTRGPAIDRRRRSARAALAGGIAAAGMCGVAWLVLSHTWPHFYDMMLGWNPEYGGGHAYHWHARRDVLRTAFAGSLPWSLAHLIAIPLAIAAVAQMRAGHAREDRYRSALFAAFYLSWLVQAMILQPRIHRYTTDSALLLAIAMVPALAPAEWTSAFVPRVVFAEVVAWCVLAHPLVDGHRLEWWRPALASGSARMRDALSLHPFGQNGRIAWVDLERVADFMRETGVRDGELLCFNDSTHELYLDLNVKPSLRYIQWGVIAGFPRHHDEVARELDSTHPRFIVTDLAGIQLPPNLPMEDLPEEWAERFPWNYPIVFRAGQYAVHAVDGAIDDASSW